MREDIYSTIQQAFGSAYLGTKDKKIYVRDGDGEQYCISISKPKLMVEFSNTPNAAKYEEVDKTIITDIKRSLGVL